MGKGAILKQTVYDNDKDDNGKVITQFDRIGAAFFYGFASLAVIFVNKIILTSFKFPYYQVLATVQFAATSIILLVLVYFRKIEVTRLSKEVFWEVVPISGMFLANVISGLGGTGSLNLRKYINLYVLIFDSIDFILTAMFTAIRRTSILLTLLGERFVLNKYATTTETVSIAIMIGGALVAAYHDLSFDLYGYVLVTINNIFTAMSGIYLKKASHGGVCNKMGVLFYNSLFSLIFMCAYLWSEHLYVHYYIHLGESTIDRTMAYTHWNRMDFLITFFLGMFTYQLYYYMFNSYFICLYVLYIF